MSAFGFKNWILVFGILCYASSSSQADEPDEPAESLETCYSDECVRVSHVLTKSIDSDVRPCDDFYAYACGKVLKESKIPPGWDNVDTVNTVVSMMTNTLMKSLKTKKPNDPDVVKKAKAFYASCNSEDEIANLGVVPLTILLKNINLPLRPPYLGALDMKDGFGTLIGKMRQQLFINFPFRFAIGMDPTNKNKSRLELLVPEKDINSRIPYRPPTRPTPQPESKTEPKTESKAAIEKNNTEEKKAAAPVKNYSRKVSKNRSFSMVTRSLDNQPTSPVKPKVVKKKKASSGSDVEGKRGDEEPKKAGKASVKKRIPKMTVPKKSENEETNNKEEVKEEKAAPTKKKKVVKKVVKKPENEETENEEEQVKKKKTGAKSAVSKNTDGLMLQKSESEVKEKASKKEEETQTEKEEENGESETDDDGQTNAKNEKGTGNKDKESNVTLEITEDENQPLIEYMINMANYLYRQTNVKLMASKTDSLREKVTEVAKIIHQIEKMTVEATEDLRENGQEMTIQELQELTLSFDTRADKKPVIDWSNLIAELLSNHPTIRKQFLEENRTIYISNMNFLKSMLKLFYETNPRDLYCAFWWTIIRGVILDLPAELRNLEFIYRQQAQLVNPGREEYCLSATLGSYGYAAAYDIISDEKTIKNLKTATDIMGYYYGPLTSMIQNSSILDPRTVMAAIVRYDSGIHTFGLPSTMTTPIGLNEAYRNVIFHDYNFFFSRFFQTYESIRAEMEMLDSSVPFGIGNPLSTKAAYSLQLNAQIVPLAYTQFPYITQGMTSLTMGMLVIPFFQQTFHHFDILANEYNLWGVKENWWSKKSVRNYYAQAECFVNAYSKECFEEIGCVDGERTLHENVADNGALRLIIQTYKNFQKQTKEPRLMDFESFSHLRLLTLSFALSMCQIQTPKKLSEILKTSKYPPSSVRVNQVMKNLPEFSEIWGCEANDPMNPADKCQVWGFIEESKRKVVKKDTESRSNSSQNEE